MMFKSIPGPCSSGFRGAARESAQVLAEASSGRIPHSHSYVSGLYLVFHGCGTQANCPAALWGAGRSMCIHPTLPPVLLAGTWLCRSPTVSPAPLRKGLGPKGSVLYPSQHQCLLPLSRGIQPAGQKTINHQKSTLQGAELHFVCHSHRATPPVSVQTLHLG